MQVQYPRLRNVCFVMAGLFWNGAKSATNLCRTLGTCFFWRLRTNETSRCQNTENKGKFQSFLTLSSSSSLLSISPQLSWSLWSSSTLLSRSCFIVANHHFLYCGHHLLRCRLHFCCHHRYHYPLHRRLNRFLYCDHHFQQYYDSSLIIFNP